MSEGEEGVVQWEGKRRHVVCPERELPRGGRRIIDVDGRSIGVFNVDGEYHAVRNVCPHQQAPLCEGWLTGTVEADEVGEYRWTHDGCIIRCPWHGWEFEVTTGRSIFNPHRVRVKTYDVVIEATAATGSAGEGDAGNGGEDPSLETYDVTVEDREVVLYV